MTGHDEDLTIIRPLSALSLVVRDPSGRVRRLPLLSGRLTIGRGEDCALVLEPQDQGASRRHAEIAVDGPVVSITDLGSTNGVFVCEKRVEKAALSPGDVLRLGQTVIVIEAAGPDLTDPADRPAPTGPSGAPAHPGPAGATGPGKAAGSSGPAGSGGAGRATGPSGQKRPASRRVLYLAALAVALVLLGLAVFSGRDKAPAPSGQAGQAGPTDEARQAGPGDKAGPAGPAKVPAPSSTAATPPPPEPAGTTPPSPAAPAASPAAATPSPTPTARPSTPVPAATPAAPASPAAQTGTPAAQAPPAKAAATPPDAIATSGAPTPEAAEKSLDHTRQGMFFYNSGNIVLAIDEWEKAVSLDPRNTQASKWLARAEGERDQLIDKNYREGLTALKYSRRDEAARAFRYVTELCRVKSDDRCADAARQLEALDNKGPREGKKP